jgi:hypothetical protein
MSGWQPDLRTSVPSGPVWRGRPVSRRRRAVLIGVVLLVVLGIPFTGVAMLYVAFEGGTESVVLNHLPAPDQDKPEVVAKRAEARAFAESALADLNRSTVVAQGPASYSAYCERGQNNYKVHEGYSHQCYVSAAHFYTWTGSFASMARNLDKELRAAGWEFSTYEGGLPHLADQYQAGRNPYQDPTPGVPVVLDFAAGWSTCYDKGDQTVCFSFADRNTDLRAQSSTFDFSQSRGVGSSRSYTETSETVDSEATIEHLLQHADGVIFATSQKDYFSVRA